MLSKDNLNALDQAMFPFIVADFRVIPEQATALLLVFGGFGAWMVRRNQIPIPGTVAQAIPEGYHDGTGKVTGDADLEPGNIKKGVTIFGMTGTHGDTYDAGVPKTGQTSSYRDGDDGTYRMGVAWPDPRFTDNEDGTVTDNMTGLIWVKAPQALDGNSGTVAWNTAIDFCNDLDFAGYSDWRLPNVRELLSLIDYGHMFGSYPLPSGHPFTGIVMDAYWSSTTYGPSPDFFAWRVSLSNALAVNEEKTKLNYVWPVRAGQ